MAKYSVYQGQLRCAECGAEVFSFRHYLSSKIISWACQDRHVTEVSLKTKKSRSDFD
jgi:hypothetical protein